MLTLLHLVFGPVGHGGIGVARYGSPNEQTQVPPEGGVLLLAQSNAMYQDEWDEWDE